MLNESQSHPNIRSIDEFTRPPGLQRSLQTYPSRGPSPLPQALNISPNGYQDTAEELKQARREIERLKSMVKNSSETLRRGTSFIALEGSFSSCRYGYRTSDGENATR